MNKSKGGVQGFTLVELMVSVGLAGLVLVIFGLAFKMGEDFKKKMMERQSEVVGVQTFLHQFNNDLRKTRGFISLSPDELKIVTNKFETNHLIDSIISYSIRVCDNAYCVSRTENKESARVYRIPLEVSFCHPISECEGENKQIMSLTPSMEKRLLGISMGEGAKKRSYYFELQGIVYGGVGGSNVWWAF